jgi:hypothetical protein
MDENQIAHWIYFSVFITIISSLPTIEFLQRFYILVASTKTVSSVHWFFEQDRMHQLVDLRWKLKLVLLCFVGSEVCPADLKDGKFWSPQ